VHSILILKTGALGDVLRTTSILPGLKERFPDGRVTWVTASGAVDLVRLHPLVDEVVAFDAKSVSEFERVLTRLSMTTWDRLLSFDDEEPMCRLASKLHAHRLSGATLDASGRRTYTPDTAPWFRMGLLSEDGKQAADALKIRNRRSHPEIFAEMLGIAVGKPHLPREEASERFGEGFVQRHDLHAHAPVIGLNTGAGGRWMSKAIPIERAAALAVSLSQRLEGRCTFLLLGGPEETARNRGIADSIGRLARWVDAGCDNSLLEFAAIVSRCAVLVTSDSLALHVAVARDVPVVAFFAPTSAAEIELYGMGEKVVSTAPDACSYKPDADTSTLTVERLQDAVVGRLARAQG
jgi:heptosyltransferase-2